jgi:hypothetical protein
MVKMLKVSDALKSASISPRAQPLYEIGWRWALTELLTEENTDKWIELIDDVRIPWIPKWIVKRVLDKLFPGVLITLLSSVLVKVGADERRVHELNPFTR